MPEITARIEVVVDDITRLGTDAIVNAANEHLAGGGGVDGAIHAAAGPGLREECAQLGGCATGDAKITDGHGLRAKRIIHAVGPRWQGGEANEDGLLLSAYENALARAEEEGLVSVAFPAISTGAYGFPPERAAKIAAGGLTMALERARSVERVVLCCADAESARLHREALQEAQREVRTR